MKAVSLSQSRPRSGNGKAWLIRLDVLEEERTAAKRHRQTFGPAGRDIRHDQAVYEVAVDLGATAVLDEIDLEI
ncbi:hypothetical protein, partial [Paraburkholderia kururiensis]|uniref:hypothetical protein n=1 Tax=Paraburkholderia kururiensis TaxID=984307 RepID=UPI0018F5F287